MNLWYKKGLLFVAAGIAYLLGQYFRGFWMETLPIRSFCHSYLENGHLYCNSPFIDTLGWPLITLGEMLALVGLVVLFANARGFRSWLRFSYVYVPLIALIVIFVFPLPLAPLAPPAPRWGAVRAFGVLYALITAGIVLYARLRAPRSATTR